MNIEEVKQYLKSYYGVFKYSPSDEVKIFCENLILLLEHCEALECKIAQLEERRE